jgi:hypothetical protein
MVGTPAQQLAALALETAQQSAPLHYAGTPIDFRITPSPAWSRSASARTLS